MDKLVLGIELGSTRIKAVLTDMRASVLAQGTYEWENRFENGIWTYSYEEIENGLRECYSSMKADYTATHGKSLCEISAIGISAMMHGLITLDKNNKPLAPFKTWRCNDAEKEAKELTDLFGFSIPARWTIAHLYKTVKDGAAYLSEINAVTTLAGYVHCLLTGRHILGVGDASGIFPIDVKTKNYDKNLADKFKALTGIDIYALFPKVLTAGENAGYLTESGAKLLDKDGELCGGILFCPPEGDAGTGMVATNSIKSLTGNVSAGTSVFSMAVLEKPLTAIYDGVDIVMTPAGAPVAMVHCNNCSSEINAWIQIFAEACGKDKNELYEKFFTFSLKGDEDCGGVLVCNYASGENLTGTEKGFPFIFHSVKGKFTLANLIRAQLYSAFATLKIGNDRFIKQEKIKIKKFYAHGGLFKTKGVCQKYLAAALNTPVAVMKCAGEGGAWGMAILAGYAAVGGMPLDDYLENKIFCGSGCTIVKPNLKTVKGFNSYVKRFRQVLKTEKIFSKV